jgi:hypothetical protein
LDKLIDPVAPPKVVQSEDQRKTLNRPNSQGEEMSTPTTTPPSRSIHGVDLRRSSRIEQRVPLLIRGTDSRGENFQETTSAVAVNLHGCRYRSRHDYVRDGWVNVQVTGTDGTYSPAIRARVRSVLSGQNPRELCQVGVELDTPGNIWGIPTPPEDWQRLLGGSNSFVGTATGVAPAPATSPERRSEVTVFPGPPIAADPATEVSSANAPGPAKTEGIVITSEQILQALKSQIQVAANRAVQASLTTQLDQAVKLGLDKIEESWRANVQQVENFSADRMAEMQKFSEKQSVAHRAHAEEISGRLQALGRSSQQTLADARRFVERLANEISPQLHARLIESFDRANSEFEAKATQVFGQHLVRLDEHTQLAAREARSQLNESIAEAHSLLSSIGGSISREYVDSLVHSSREQTLGRLEERLGEHYTAFEQQNELARRRIDEIARQLESLTAETRQSHREHQQDVSGVLSLLGNANTGVTQESLDSLLNTSREKILSHLEWRLGEVSGHFERLLGEVRNRADNFAQQIEPLGQAARGFEAAAARVSERELVRLMEQKQAMSREVSLELEARTSEARAFLQKSANTTLDEFQRRVELQIDLMLAEANERVTSSIASLEAETSTAIESRRRTLETDVARAAEQAAVEFRSGIKAFLYSCLVAAVGAVDQHAQTTLAGLATDPGSLPRELDAPGGSSPRPDDPAIQSKNF